MAEICKNSYNKKKMRVPWRNSCPTFVYCLIMSFSVYIYLCLLMLSLWESFALYTVTWCWLYLFNYFVLIMIFLLMIYGDSSIRFLIGFDFFINSSMSWRVKIKHQSFGHRSLEVYTHSLYHCNEIECSQQTHNVLSKFIWRP